MANDLHTAIRGWLTYIMPDVVARLLKHITIDFLLELSKEPTIHGPYSIGIEKLRGPITRINFYIVATDDAMVLATTATIKDAPEDYKPTLYFDMFFFIEDFPTEIADAYHLQQLVDTLTDQYQEVTA